MPGGAAAPHTPTLTWTVGIIIVVLVGYHFLIKKRG
jgi:hypothetical protein